MEDELIQILSNTQQADAGIRKAAELELKRNNLNPAFPQALANIASHASVDTKVRQSALSTLRLFIEENWAPDPDNEAPQVPIQPEARIQLRESLLKLAIIGDEDRRIKIAASYAVGKIAMNDFPEHWPDLLQKTLAVIPAGSDTQLYGALRVLGDLIEENLSEDQFFSMARDIAQTLTETALNENRRPALRALAISIFRSCFEMMDMIKDEHGKEVKAFAEELLKQWNPFFITVLKTRLPEADLSGGQQPEAWNDLITLKLQVAKTLIRIRRVFPSLLLPQSTALFSAVWEELNLLQDAHSLLYIDNDAQGRLENADQLPYTLDFLILEELDFLNQCFRAEPVRAELDVQLKAHASGADVPWMIEIVRMLVSYARISREEEELWDIDCSLFLAEETSVSANYTARVAASDLLIKMGEWFDQKTVEALFAFTKTLFPGDGSASSWRNQESALFLFVMLESDRQDLEKGLPAPISASYLELVDFAIDRHEEPLLRARGYLVAGMLCRAIELPDVLLDRTIASIVQEEAEVVQVSCIKAVEGLINAEKVTVDKQIPIIKAIEQYMSGKDPEEMESADELLVTLSEALRAATRLDCRVALSSDVPSIDLLFLLARTGASNFQVTMMISEALEEIVRSLSGAEAYAALCSKVLPTLMGAFDVSRITDDSPLVTVAVELLEVLTQHACEPLPPGFVSAVFPKLTQVLMESNEGDVLRPAAESAKWVLQHDHQQVFEFADESGRSGLEVCLHVIDRLLGPTIEDNSATEVGGLAAELVEKAGHDRLGPFLPQLLQAVASRLATAQAAQLIQSLILVFARLSLNTPKEVVDFLDSVQINSRNGLQVVIPKWLENSVNFAGFDEIRQNVIALSKLFTLNDPRLAQIQVKGDLVVSNDTRIKTRSRSKQNPDQWTQVPAQVKIIKLLIEELMLASGHKSAADIASAAVGGELDSDSDDEGWEDDDDALDLGLGTTKADLMSILDGPGRRYPDNETNKYLTEFFMRCGTENLANFNDVYVYLNVEEQKKIHDVVNSQVQ
ncbi:importin-9 [Emericellopsis cladophorae]|uniref:Importin-9 n=1 Tax=Emericellopsis cladophorae TaxID=2686198 RepID=A0A9Q0BBW8_9HYPO|nr:importin-9 [Emericellopsis cladophorae]KAI6778489.1 importin-9 [Emericellopsis cladophorae]